MSLQSTACFLERGVCLALGVGTGAVFINIILLPLMAIFYPEILPVWGRWPQVPSTLRNAAAKVHVVNSF